MSTKTLLLIDTYALAHRAFHAFPSELKTKRGEQTNAIYGFSSMLLQVLKLFQPDFIVCALDSKGPTIRHQQYQEYKANRPKMDEGLAEQIAKIKKLIDTFNIPALEKQGYEADDIIGSIVKSPEYEDLDKIIVTGDRDLFQLLNGKVRVYLAGSSFSASKIYDDKNVIDKLGFPANYLVDFKALRGDPSDNIPGVPGIGEKSALDLIVKYSDLDNVYQHLDELKPALRTKLEAGKELAYLSKKLAQIITDLHIDIDLPISEYDDIAFDEGRKLFEYYEFRSLVGKLLQLRPDLKEPESAISPLNLDFEKVKVEKPEEVLSMLKIVKSVDEVVVYNEDLPNLFSKPSRIFLAIPDKVFSVSTENSNKELRQFLREGEYIAYDSKALGHALSNLEIDFKGVRDDVSLMDYLLTGGAVKIGLQASLLRYLGIKGEQEEQPGLFEDSTGYTHAYQVLLLYRVVKIKFDNSIAADAEPNIQTLYRSVEKPLVGVLIKLERNGIKLDSKFLMEFAKELGTKITRLEEEIYDIAGQTFNISSPKQLSEILFDKLQLPKGKKTKTGGYSTNERILNNYVNDYPIVAKILEYRELFKLKSTYTNTLIAQINEKTGRIHTSFNQTIVATGRLSSTNPNLQNIPTSTELGQEIRKAFIAEKNKILISFDYSQQELRLLAHLSKEPKLMEAFVNNIDIHAATASQLFNMPVVKVTKEQRRIGKTVNFGVIYGISAFGLGDRLKIPTEEAQSFIDTFFAGYPRVKVYFEQLKAEARNNGYVESLLGRRRSANMLNSPNYQLRQAAEREIINFPLQGSAADIMKIAMVKCNELVDKRYADFAKMVLQVHDELIFEVEDGKEELLTEFQNEIKYLMIKAVKLTVPVVVDSKSGLNWSEL
jgi:DNA polymerase-1